MNDDIRRIQEDLQRQRQDLQRQRQEVERSAFLLKNTRPRVFSGDDGSYKSPNKRFAFGRSDSALLPPFSITTRLTGIGVTAGTINGIIPSNLFQFGTTEEDCTIICQGNTSNGVVTSAELIEGPPDGKPQEASTGSAPTKVYASLVRIQNKIPSRLVLGSITAYVTFTNCGLTYPPSYIFSWGYEG